MKDNREKLLEAIDQHKADLDEKELEMVLRFIHCLKDFREKT